eukprot:7509885-Lingulodinium_polyedra.AAC.1
MHERTEELAAQDLQARKDYQNLEFLVVDMEDGMDHWEPGMNRALYRTEELEDERELSRIRRQEVFYRDMGKDEMRERS